MHPFWSTTAENGTSSSACALTDNVQMLTAQVPVKTAACLLVVADVLALFVFLVFVVSYRRQLKGLGTRVTDPRGLRRCSNAPTVLLLCAVAILGAMTLRACAVAAADKKTHDIDRIRDLSSFTVFVRNLPHNATEAEVC